MDENKDITCHSQSIPWTDEEVFKLLHPFLLALADAIGATARLDDMVTFDEYQTLTGVASALEEFTPRPGLMTTLILRSTLHGPSYRPALRALKSATQDILETQRITTLKAIAPLIDLQAERSMEVACDWSSALDVPLAQWRDSRSQPRRLLPTGLLGQLAIFRPRKGRVLDRARVLASTFDDEGLASAVAHYETSSSEVSMTSLEDELHAAAQRILDKLSSVLKSRQQLDHQMHVTQSFLVLAEPLAAQIRQRLESIRERLQLETKMFQEDLDHFVRSSLDSVEVSMRDLMEGRESWSEETLWNQFKTRGVFAEILAHFQPLKHRYERLLVQWQRELESFSGEMGALRADVLRDIDPDAFPSLLPAEHSSIRIKNALDRAAGTTLGLGAVGTVGVVLTGTGSTLLAFMLARPVIVFLVSAITVTATAWRLFSNPKARRRKCAQDKRQVMETRLHAMLSAEALNHEKHAQEIMDKFLAAAYDNYAPVLVDARMAALRAELEVEMIDRVLADTRRAILTIAET